MRDFEKLTAFESVPVTYDTTTAPRDLERENAELRERIRWLERGDVLHVLTDQEYIDRGRREREMQASIDALDRDNARLRELALKLHAGYVGMVTDYEGIWEDYVRENSGWVNQELAEMRAECDSRRHKFDAMMCECGVEVTE